MSDPATPDARQRKRRNASQTKARIVQAAQQSFACQGYTHTRLRDIAQAADVAVSLVPQHFGSKAELFEAALLAAMASNRAMDAPMDDLARAMIDYVSGGGDITLPTMVILSIGDPEARAITTRILVDQIVPALAEKLGPPDAEARALELTMLATGFLIYARQLPAGAVSERTRRRFITLIQETLDGDTHLA
ncbi:MAG: TetR/AcrR family transcriptional regulator [Sphingobium sp.]